jgi:hypothetical protein
MEHVPTIGGSLTRLECCTISDVEPYFFQPSESWTKAPDTAQGAYLASEIPWKSRNKYLIQ